MELKKIILFGLFLSCGVLFGQGFKMHFSNSFADCFGAVEVTDYSNPSHLQFPGNMGFRDDLVGLDPDFHEVNSVWLRLEPNVKGNFTFEISTENNTDFSYFLFKADDNSFCEQLEADQARPILHQGYRSQHLSTTGDHFRGNVECGEHDVFYLLIHTNSTFKSNITVRYKRIGQVTVSNAVIQDFRTGKSQNFIRLRIRDKETGEPIEANTIISGVNKDNCLFMGTDFIFDASSAKMVQIESNTQGYFLFYKEWETKGSVGKNLDVLIELEKLSPGKKLALEDIKFEEDTDEFLPISSTALKRLLDFMAVNDELRIEIRGHVNAPDHENTSKVKGLSEERAKAVRDFLKENGIDASRMVVVGMGNTEMIYEKPTNLAEEEANRRVEIRIID